MSGAALESRLQESGIDRSRCAILGGASSRSAPRILYPAIELRELPDLPELASPAELMTRAFEGVDLKPVILDRLDRLKAAPASAGLLMDLSLIFQFYGRREEALGFQQRALELARVYRVLPDRPGALRVLVLVTAGDLMVNMPVELILRDRDVRLTKLFVLPGGAMPGAIPDHDVALTAISEFDETRETLTQLQDRLADWPRRVLNQPRRILELARDRLFRLLAGVPGLRVPPTARLGREDLAALARSETEIADRLPGAGFPVIARPVGSHGGKGLTRLDAAPDFAALLEAEPAALFYVTGFVDYRSSDGLYRKYRIAFIEGRPFLCHLAISEHWMIHFINSGMGRDAAKRAEESRTIDAFQAGFLRCHGPALGSLAARIGLDYFVIDCGETPEGALVIFEADNAAVIHDLDPPELYPYRRPQMRRVFDAFEVMLRARAAGR